jgi:hypothetical protein
MSAIAILGWGSLLWEDAPDFDRWREAWRFDGPALKLEFSRISARRIGALTLVVDPAHGTLNRVAWCPSRRHVDAEAIADLQRREGATARNIGVVSSGGGAMRARDLGTARSVLSWAQLKLLDVVLWTDLPSNFEEKTNRGFSVPEAISYLNTLDPAAKAKAAEYLQNAPEFIQTPLLTALNRDFPSGM